MAPAQHAKKPAAARKASGGRRPATPSSTAGLFQRHQRDLTAVALFIAGLFIILAEAHALGPLGRAVSRGVTDLFGVGRFVLGAACLVVAVALVVGRLDFERVRLLWGGLVGLAAICALFDVLDGRPGVHATQAVLGHAGGWVGVGLGGGVAAGVGEAGAIVISLAALVVALIVLTGVGLRDLGHGAVVVTRFIGRTLGRWWAARPSPQTPPMASRVAPLAPPVASEGPGGDPGAVAPPVEDRDDADDADEFADEPPVEEWFEEPTAPAAEPPRPVPVSSGPSTWELPPLSLLSRTRDQRLDRSVVEAAGRELVTALAAHGVETTLVGATVGPTVTRFELELGPGVKVARLTSLHKDIAYAMASPDVRILAPIPGRSAIGVEVPNRQRSLVALGDLLADEEALARSHPLDVPIGRDIAGRTVVVNLGEMPHILISGATGAGKSSALNSLITSLVMRATPDEVRLLLIDPKRVEMGQYADLPHLLDAVVVDPKKAANALAWAVREMERRYDLLAENGARDIAGYEAMRAAGELDSGPTDSELVADVFDEVVGESLEPTRRPVPEHLPYVVVVVDELNDLMMVAARDVEEAVVRIAQMARAVGIHLVLATQRPSVDVITGVIKANVPSRMAFAVSSIADSRVILDQAGAERLIGKGDMLLLTASSNVARRLQSPWVSEDEVRHVVDFWRAQGPRPGTVVAVDSAGHVTSNVGGEDDDDVVLARARELVLQTQSGSTSMLQRKLRVGFARAGRLMDQLEEEGVVAPGEGSKARRVLMTLDEYRSTHAS